MRCKNRGNKDSRRAVSTANNTDRTCLLRSHTKEQRTEECGKYTKLCGCAKKPADTPDPSGTSEPTTPTQETTQSTQAPTDKPTDATESEKDDSTETEAPADKGCGGCGSSAALSALAIVAVVGSALVIKKKED